MIILIFALVWLGMSRVLEKGYYYVTYFNESVQGLSADSPVKYRGVSIGRVDQIGVAPDSKLIEVVLKIESGQQLDEGIVAQLKSVGITGSVFVELDRIKEGDPDQSPPLTFPSEYPIVASKPSDIQRILRVIDEFVEQIKILDLPGISVKVKASLDLLNEGIEAADLGGLSEGFQASLNGVQNILEDENIPKFLDSAAEAGQALNLLVAEARTTMKRLDHTLARVDGIVTSEEATIRQSISDLQSALEKAHNLLAAGTTMVNGTNEAVSQIRPYLVSSARNLERATQKLDRLMELLNQQPSRLLVGEPPSPRDVETMVHYDE
jgi:phospholipid/cholesterol/gamma-HCH transport system substrate-binding protein